MSVDRASQAPAADSEAQQVHRIEGVVERQRRRGRPVNYQEILDLNDRNVPEHLRDVRTREFAENEYSIDIYTDRQFHELEKERIWSRSWQFVCLEEQIPAAGDHIVYDIVDKSYLVIRTEGGEIKAFPNSCLHRGRRLKQYGGHCSEIRCPFHGMAWQLDGKLQDIPMEWEFEHVDKGEFNLPEVATGVWRGFVFINPDPDASESLADYLGELDEQFATWYAADRYLQAHVSKKLHCNWKIAMEAFMECWHLQSTHPQAVGYVGVPLCQIDMYENFSRFTTPSEVLGPFSKDRTPEEMLRSTMDIREGEEFAIELLPDETAREYVARTTREKWRAIIGDSIDEWSEADLVDNFTYLVFPNFWPWGGVHKIVYRFRPNGDDHKSCIMEVMMMSPFPGERPAPAEEVALGFDDDWGSVPGLGMLGPLLDQDAFNVTQVQRGLQTTVRDTVTLASHEENMLKWYRHRYDDAIQDGAN